MLNETQFLILDEPTNHMDIEAAETFAIAIKEFSGAVLLVTHDRLFAEKTGEKGSISFWNINRKGNESKLIVNTVKYIK
jgi:ATPase subunit of ABC transporter with duplicated ATPase domains